MTEDPFQSPAAPLDAGPERDARPGIPWENEQSFPALVETFKAIFWDASGLFQSAGQDLPIGSALTYALIIGLIGGVGASIWGVLTSALLSIGGDPVHWLSSLGGSGVGSLVSVPVGVVTGVIIGSGLVHLMLVLVGAPHRSFDTTLRAVGFASGTAAIFQLIPFIGPLIGYAFGVVLEVRAIRAMHGTTSSTAAMAVLLPTVVCAGLVGLFGAAAYLFFQRA